MPRGGTSSALSLKIAQLNANSLLAHIDLIRDFLVSNFFHIISISETWLKPHVIDKLVEIKDYFIIRNDRLGKRGGGVACYIHKSLKANVKAVSPGNIVVAGDLNCDLLLNNFESDYLRDMTRSLSLQIVDSNPTHHTACSDSLLDIFMVDDATKVLSFIKSDVPFICGHDILQLSYTFRAPPNTARRVKSRDYHNFDSAAFNAAAKAALRNLDILTPDCLGSSSQVDSFIDTVQNSLDILDVHAPQWSFVTTRPAPWITAELAERARRCKLLYKRAKRHEYIYGRLTSISDSGMLWRQLASLGLVKTSYSSPLNFFTADQLNSYYTSISCVLPLCSRDELNSILDARRLVSAGSCFDFHHVTVAEVVRLLSDTVTESRSFGPDQMSPLMIRATISCLAPRLADLFNTCFDISYFPSAWKRTLIRPMSKVNAPSSPSDTRPIANLCELSKLYERLAHKQIANFLHDSNFLDSLIDPYQSGYRKAYSTQTALLRLTHDIRAAADERRVTVLVLFDFSKAFDTVSHTILLTKLSKCGFSISSLKWMHSYLTGRSQAVVDGSAHSAWLPTSAGVPQGSVLGPLLFSMFINDICNSLEHSRHIIFADDIQIYLSHPVELNMGLVRIHHDVGVIADYAVSNGLSLNLRKSSVLISGSATYVNRISLDLLPPIIVNRVALPYVTEIHNLGVVFKSNLSWAGHVSAVSRKAVTSVADCVRKEKILSGNSHV
ncbi:uncharacterized protein LOC118646356 [Monomorium pharaonis]|uniref:uncharacterized protein LOC118646356 n=1 Tax=Monomorium pharaonis TaxID=307658 RepID=UPI001747C553|nr:uncharacterized protein LOC118646356 [Monomorium pharaonis]